MPKIDGIIVAVKEKNETLCNYLSYNYSLPIDKFHLITNEEGVGICDKYNKGIDSVLKATNPEDNSWVIFSHDDVEICSNNLEKELNSMHKIGADIVTVAGTTQIPTINPGYWWHNLRTASFRGSGAVIHITPGGGNMNHIESYGPYPQQIAAFDGLWFAVKTKSLLNTKLRFDSATFDIEYHYYDADFAATARSLGLKIWCAGILVFHNKLGKSMDEESFTASQHKFINKWNKNSSEYFKYEVLPSDNSFIKKSIIC